MRSRRRSSSSCRGCIGFSSLPADRRSRSVARRSIWHQAGRRLGATYLLTGTIAKARRCLRDYGGTLPCTRQQRGVGGTVYITGGRPDAHAYRAWQQRLPVRSSRASSSPRPCRRGTCRPNSSTPGRRTTAASGTCIRFNRRDNEHGSRHVQPSRLQLDPRFAAGACGVVVHALSERVSGILAR